MPEDTVLPIREFAQITGISRETLRFYDKIGLLAPEYRGENGYRYYGTRQMDLAFLIGELRELGIGLDEIRRYAETRSPERMLTFFEEQDARIETEIDRLRSIQALLHMRNQMAVEAMRHVPCAVFLEERSREPIFLGPMFSGGRYTDAERVSQTYNDALDHGIDLSYPFGDVLPQKNLEAAGWLSPSRYFFKVHKGNNAYKREGTYAVFYRSPIDGPAVEFYSPLLLFLKEQGLHMVGDVYEERPLDELSTQEWGEFVLRVEVRVEK